MEKKVVKGKKLVFNRSLFLLSLFFVVMLYLVLKSDFTLITAKVSYQSDFVDDSLGMIDNVDKSNILLPNSRLQVGDFLVVDKKEYRLDREIILDIFIKKETVRKGNLNKVNYEFKNIGKDRDIAFVWKVDASSYDEVNINNKKYSLDNDFSVYADKIDFYKNNAKKYYLTFEDVKQAFGSVSLYYNSNEKILTAKSNQIALHKDEKLAMDPAGGNISCILGTSSIAANCAAGAGPGCEPGETIAMSAAYTGNCSTSSFFQIDAKSSDNLCNIQYSSGSISGITAIPSLSASTVSGTWTVPSAMDSGLVLSMNLDNNTQDQSGNSNHGTASGAYCSTSGKFGNACSFDGVNDYISAGGLSLPDQRTVSAWIKTSTANTGILSRYSDAGYYQYRLFIEPNGNVSFEIGQTGSFSTIVSSRRLVNDNQWHHIAGTYDVSELKIYVDGILEKSVGETRSTPRANYKFCIGTNRYDCVNLFAGKAYFNGLIDEVKIWNRALSAIEISNLYSGSIPSECRGKTATATTASLWEGTPLTGFQLATATADGSFNFAAAACADADSDGYTDTACGGTDCNDANPAINPGAAEICGNGIDEDCSGADLTCPVQCDADSDGYDSSNVTCSGNDCNDNNPAIYPTAFELCDGIDNQCPGDVGYGIIDEGCAPECDADADSYDNLNATCSGNDCNDNNAVIYPNAPEICSNAIDEDCSGADESCPIKTTFDGSTTNFAAEADITAVQNAILEKTTYGKIQFTQTADFSNADLDKYIYIQNNLAGIDTNNLPALNKPATIAFYGLTFTNPKLLKNGVSCPSTQCQILSYVGGTLTATVTGFSNFTAAETTSRLDHQPIFSHIKVELTDYRDSNTPEELEFIKTHYDVIIGGGADYQGDAPQFRYTNYFDMYVITEWAGFEYLDAKSWAESRGVNFEDFFIHYAEPTRACISVPSGSPDDLRDGVQDGKECYDLPAGSRVPSYGWYGSGGNLTKHRARIITNPGNPNYRAWKRDWLSGVMGNTFDGVFVDNTVFTTIAGPPTIESGGTIQEYPTNPWTTYGNDILTMFKEFKQRFGTTKVQLPNVANLYDKGNSNRLYNCTGDPDCPYVWGLSREAALQPHKEVGNPKIRAEDIYYSEAAGVKNIVEVRISLERSIMPGLALYYLVKGDSSYISPYQNYRLIGAGQDPRENQWFEAVAYDIGQPKNDPPGAVKYSTLAKGVDPSSANKDTMNVTSVVKSGSVYRLTDPTKNWTDEFWYNKRIVFPSGFEIVVYHSGSNWIDVYNPSEIPMAGQYQLGDFVYSVFAREFDRALVLFKPKPSWEATIPTDDTSATVHNLPVTTDNPTGQYFILKTNGTLEPTPITTISLRNTDGAVLIKADVLNDTQPPTVPTNLTAQVVSSTQINLAWSASTDDVGVAGYKIFRDDVQVGTSTTVSYQDTGLTASTTYTYQVSAYDGKGSDSGKSLAASATTLAIGCIDADLDTYYIYDAINCPAGNDCNDANANIYPGAVEICGNGIDEDCSGADLDCVACIDADADGYNTTINCLTGTDCDDANPAINPSAVEVCDGIDNNCIAGIDENPAALCLNYCLGDELKYNGICTVGVCLYSGAPCSNLDVTDSLCIGIELYRNITDYSCITNQCQLINQSFTLEKSCTFSCSLAGCQPSYATFDGQTTNFAAEADITVVNNAILEKTTSGKIQFTQTADFSNADLDRYVYIQNNLIGINTLNLPTLNKPATIAFYGLTFTNPKLLKDGVSCPSTQCQIISYAGGTLTATVTGFSNFTVAETTAATCADIGADCIELTACGTLNQANKYYLLMNDVRSEGTCFTISALGVTLDLNGFTVTYDDFPNTGLPNPGFEVGTGEVPSDWDLTNAPSAKRRPTSELPLAEKWYLKIIEAGDGEEIVSPWTYLPANANAMAHFVRAEAIWTYPNCLNLSTPSIRPPNCQAPVINFSVEYEDGSIVFSQSYGNAAFNASESEITPVFTTKPTLGRYRLHFKLVKGFGQNISIDQMDLRPSGDDLGFPVGFYGVYISSGAGASIKNGKIVQGQAKGPTNHNIYTRIFPGNIEVNNMYLESNGVESANIVALYIGGKIANSTLVSNSLYRLGSRHQIRGAIYMGGSQATTISGNNISSGRGLVCMLLVAANSTISNNYCLIKTAITNHHGIAFGGISGGNGAKIFNNIIVGDPGQGIMATFSEIEIFNNTIYLKSQAPNVEFGRLGLNAMRLEDWGDRRCKAKVYDNKFFLTGDFDDYYFDFDSTRPQAVSGILNDCGGGAEFYNNYIKVDVIDSNSIGTGVEATGGYYSNETTIWRNNTIESNHNNVVFGGFGSYGSNTRNTTFVSNTLIKGLNPLPDYSTFSVYRITAAIDNPHLIDTKLINGATMDVNIYAPLSRYSYYIDWFLDVAVKDNSNNPIQGALVEIKNITGAVVFSGTTNSQGRIDDIVLNQYRRYRVSGGSDTRVYQTPHTITVTAAGYQPQTRTLTMDASKTETFTLATTGKTCADIGANCIELNACGTLNQANKYYLLMNDVASEGTCFTISASGVTLDLNGKTVTYDDFPNTGLPNPGFEFGTGEVPSDWDLTNAPSAKRRPNYERPMVGRWHLLFNNTQTGEEVISPWTYLPANKQVMAYFIRGSATYAYPRCCCVPSCGPVAATCADGPCEAPTITMSVEFENSSIVYVSRPHNNTQEYNFRTFNTPGQYRLHFYFNQSWGHDFSIDQMDLRSRDNYGIRVSATDVTITNGNIIQGQAKSSYSHGIYVGTRTIVAKVYSYANGMESSNIYSGWMSGLNIQNNIIVSDVPYVFNRHQLNAPIGLGQSGSNVIANNNISAGAAWGCIYTSFGGGSNLIYNNRCTTHSTVTNHHGIVTYSSKNNRIFNNIIFANPGQGIFLSSGFDGTEIYNNTVTLNGTAPNFEYALYGLVGIHLNDYGGRNSNVKVYDNKVYINGGLDPYFLPTFAGISAGKAILGMMNAASGDNISFYNNYISVNITDPEVYGIGIEVGGKNGYTNVTWFNNTIESNNKNIMFGGYGGVSKNTSLVSNTFIKGQTIIGTYNTIYTLRSIVVIDDVHLLDTKLLNGASLENAYLYTSDPYDFYVDWYLDVLAKDSSGNPITGAIVEIKNVNGTAVFSGATNSQGKIDKIILNQYKRWGAPRDTNPKGFTNQTPHTLTIRASGFTDYTATVTMDSSKTLTAAMTPTTSARCTLSVQTSGTQTTVSCGSGLSTRDFKLVFDTTKGGGITELHDVNSASNPTGFGPNCVTGWPGNLFYTHFDPDGKANWFSSYYSSSTVQVIENNPSRVFVRQLTYPSSTGTNTNTNITYNFTYTIYPSGAVYLDARIQFSPLINSNFRLTSMGWAAGASGTFSTETIDPFQLTEPGADWETTNPAFFVVNNSFASPYCGVMITPFKAILQANGYFSSLWGLFNKDYLLHSVGQDNAVPGATFSNRFFIRAKPLGMTGIRGSLSILPYALDFRNPSSLTVSTGSVSGDGFDELRGVYELNAASNAVDFSIDAIYTRYEPSFLINNFNPAAPNTITVGGVTKYLNVDYSATKLNSNTLLINYFGDINSVSRIIVGQVTLQTCSAQGGTICSASESCSGTWLAASDTTRCCSGTCTTTGCIDADLDTYYIYDAINCPTGNDCNDNNANIHPGAIEICGNGIDEDCNGADLACVACIDADADGYNTTINCLTGTDCNDANPTINPGAVEVCNNIDDNCILGIDENPAALCQNYCLGDELKYSGICTAGICLYSGALCSNLDVTNNLCIGTELYRNITDYSCITNQCQLINQSFTSIKSCTFSCSLAGCQPSYSTFNGATTNFAAEADITVVNNAILEKTTSGKIQFTQTADFSNADLDRYVYIQNNLIGINTLNLPTLNKPATIAFYGLTFTNPKLLKNGVSCPSTQCQIISYAGGTLTATVTGFSNFTAAETTAATCADIGADCIELTACGTLSQANKYYLLMNDVRSEGTCFTISALGVTLDLNGFTVTYDDFPNTGLPNPGFELGIDDVPTDWDLSRAPHAKRRPNYEQQMAGKWHLLFDGNTTDGEEIVSPWTYLQANKQAMAYVLNAYPDWKWTNAWPTPKVPPMRKIIIEYEDGSIVYQTNFTDAWGFGFITKPVVGRYRIRYIVEQANDLAWFPLGLRIDQLDLRTTGRAGFTGFGGALGNFSGEKIYGIKLNQYNAVIKNGRVIQGRGGSSFSHALWLTSGSKVDNVYSYTYGMIAKNVEGTAGNVEIMNSNFESDNLYVFRRGDLEAVIHLGSSAGPNSVHHNTINSGPGWSCITVSGGSNHMIYNNNCTTRTTITNHYGITTYATTYTKIFNNYIEASPGSGIEMGSGWGFNNSEIYNNTIKTNGVAPNLESPSMLSDAIRLNDYGGGTSNVSVHDNDIYITGGVDPYYLQNPANRGQGVRKILNGIMNGVTGDNNSFYNNKIVVNITDPDVLGSGIVVGNIKGSNSQVWYNNTIESNNKNIVFGGYAPYSINTLLKSNTLIKGTNIVGIYYTIFTTEDNKAIIQNAHFLDTKLENGASLENARLITGDRSDTPELDQYSLYVDWYLDVKVQDASLQPIQNANVEVKNISGDVVYSGLTDANGRIRNVILNQYKRYGATWGGDPKGFINQTPHTITIRASGFTDYTTTVNMNESKAETFTLISTGKTCADIGANCIELSACGTLSQANKYYLLMNDVRSEGTCFTISASGVTLDLNGFTVTYDDFPNTGLPNPGFEFGTGEVPTDWNLTNAPHAKRRPNYEWPMVGKWHLLFDQNTTDGEEIVSPWTYLPANKQAMVYLLNVFPDYVYTDAFPPPPRVPPTRKIIVEFEDGSTVYSTNFTHEWGFGFITKPVVGKYRIRFIIEKANDIAYRPVRIDQLDIRTTGNVGATLGTFTGEKIYGISISKTYVTVKNGRIIQGRGGSSFGHSIYHYDADYLKVENIYSSTHGMVAGNVYGIWTSNAEVLNSTFESTTPYIFRMDDVESAVYLINGLGNKVHDNTISTGEGWGCITVIGVTNVDANHLIYNNTCRMRSVIKNNYGIISVRSPKTKIFNNVIEASPGHGIFLSGDASGPFDGSEVYNNTIKMNGTAPQITVELGTNPLFAIKLNDYQGGISNIKVYNNDIYITGSIDPYFLQNPGMQSTRPKVITGIANWVTGQNISIFNNHIVVNISDSNVFGGGIEIGGRYDSAVWFDNVIESNSKNVIFGGYIDLSQNTRLISNTFIKASTVIEPYYTISTLSVARIHDVHFIDTKLLNGASLENAYLFTWDPTGTGEQYDFYVDWYLNLSVQNPSLQAIQNANVEIKNVTGGIVFSGMTDANGRIDKIILNQYMRYGARWDGNPKGFVNQTPHTVTVSKTGYQPQTRQVTMDASKTEIFTLTSANIYYVATNGDDVTGDGSLANPWRTLNHAVLAIQDGSTVIVLDGTYNEAVNFNRMFSKLTTFRAANPYKARLTSSSSSRPITISGTNLLIKDFEIFGQPTNGYFVVLIGDISSLTGAENITLENNIIHDSYNNDLIKIVNRIKFITIRGNLLYNPHPTSTMGTQHLDINTLTDVIVEDNILLNDYEWSGRPASNELQGFIVIKNSGSQKISERFIVRRNIFLNWYGRSDQPFLLLGEDGKPFYEAEDVMVENNLFIGNSLNPIVSALNYKGVRNVTFRANTITGDLPGSAYAARINQELVNPINTELFFYNNIWSDPTGTMNRFSIVPIGNATNIVISNNLYWNGGNPIPTQDTLLNYLLDTRAKIGDPKLGAQTNIAFPRWNSSSGFFLSRSRTLREEFERLVSLYGLPQGSAAIDAANPVNMPTHDILGNPRTGQGLGPDIGAVEVQLVCTDADSDTYSAYDAVNCPTGNDCNDANPAINPGAAEVCDGIDNNCDAVIDQITRNCNIAHYGACSIGIEACTAGLWQGCPAPAAEVCDGIDNDCDNTLDGSEGLAQQCGTTDIGECSYGTESCDNTGNWINCNAITPTVELCDGLDTDCDGKLDGSENFSAQSCYSGPAGTQGVGTCRAGTQSCIDTGWGICTGEMLPANEACNGLDDNCDGILPLNEYDTDADTYMICENDCNDNNAAINPSAAEICDGINDDNCDGTVDEGCSCVTDTSRQCGIDTGACEFGTQTCIAGAWGACQGGITPTTESCDGSDTDCDGVLDGLEGFADQSCYTGPAGTAGTGTCRAGTQSCSDTGWGSCAGEILPAAEICGNNVDEDCDGADLICPCTITNIYWDRTEATENTIVTLTAETANCNGKNIGYEIYERDLIGDDLITTISPTIIINNKTQATWLAVLQPDCAGLCDPSEYYFIATLFEDPLITATSGLLIVHATTADTTPPTLTINPNTIATGTVQNQSKVMINITCTDVNRRNVILNFNSLNETFEHNIADVFWKEKYLPIGAYSFYVICDDTFNNTAVTETRSFTITDLCNNNRCDSEIGEWCGSCPADCGICPPPPTQEQPSAGGGGGGGGGGGYFISSTTKAEEIKPIAEEIPEITEAAEEPFELRTTSTFAEPLKITDTVLTIVNNEETPLQNIQIDIKTPEEWDILLPKVDSIGSKQAIDVIVRFTIPPTEKGTKTLNVNVKTDKGESAIDIPVQIGKLPEFVVAPKPSLTAYSGEEKAKFYTIYENKEEEKTGVYVELNVNKDKSTKILDYTGPYQIATGETLQLSKYYKIEYLPKGIYNVHATIYEKGKKIGESDIKLDLTNR